MASSSDNPIKRLIRETHRRSLWQVLVVLAASVLPGVAAGQAPLQFADLGTCELESGEVIRDCRVGYRTFGRLNAERSNAILFPTALWNRTDAAGELFGPQGLLDTSEWFVIAVDAFGNGVSSSPSNSPTQGGASFPQFTIRDMVNSQYRCQRSRTRKLVHARCRHNVQRQRHRGTGRSSRS